jgi:arylsulfatase A-like enzyme
VRILRSFVVCTLFGVLALTVGLSFGVPQCVAAQEGTTARRPNFIVVVTDDQRPDTIHALGNPIIRTPSLDSLVARGLTFTRAVAPDPLCVPSRAEIMTGCREFSNGVSSLGGGRMKPELVLWAQAMRDAGYYSWYVGKWMNDGRPINRGYDETLGLFGSGGGKWPMQNMVDWHGFEVTGYRGWIFQKDDGTKLPEMGVGLTPQISEYFGDAAISFINRKPDKPFFLHVNFTAPHDPLLMPPDHEGMYEPGDMPLPENFLPRHPFDHGNLEGRDERLLPWPRTPQIVRADLAVYYAVITHMDRQLGRIIQALKETGQADNTYVIFTSDHGLAVGSHGLRGKQNMYEHTVGVPLVITGPGITGGKKTAAQCYLRDMYPTVCDLAGIPIPKTVQGRSLVPIIRGRKQSIYACIFGHFRDTQRMIRTDRWKLVWYPKIERHQLFDLISDPNELRDLSGDPRHAAVLAELKAKLEAWQHEVGDPLVKQ